MTGRAPANPAPATAADLPHVAGAPPSAAPGYTALGSDGATIVVDLSRRTVRLPIAGGLNGRADPGGRPVEKG